MNAAQERPAQNRKDANVGAIKILQEEHLKFDGVLDRMAVIFHANRLRRGLREFVHEADIGDGFAERRHKRFTRQAKAVRFAIMRSAEHDEGTLLVRREHGGISVAIRFPTAKGADVRRGDADERIFRAWGRGALHEFSNGLARFVGVVGISGAGVRRIALGRRDEFVDARQALHFKGFVFEESSLAERVEQMLFEFADLDFAGDPNQVGAQIQTGLLAVETSQALHQLRRNEQHGIGEFQRIANQQAGMLGIGGWNEIESQPETGEWIWHITTIAWGSSGQACQTNGFRTVSVP